MCIDPMKFLAADSAAAQSGYLAAVARNQQQLRERQADLFGQEALRAIRALEVTGGHAQSKILMTTALRDATNVMTAFREQADGYLVKPIDRAKLNGYLRQFRLVETPGGPA